MAASRKRGSKKGPRKGASKKRAKKKKAARRGPSPKQSGPRSSGPRFAGGGAGKKAAKKSAKKGRKKSAKKAARRRASKVAPSGGTGSSLWNQVLGKAQEEEKKHAGLVRLNAYLARCGVASRRKCDEWIEQGRVSIGGEIVRELGSKVDPLRDVVAVDGEALQPEKPVYVLLHKPKGVVCTNARGEEKTRAIDLISHVRGRVFPVGRLDLDSEGLLLLTNDGRFAESMTHPRYGVPKTYKVTLRGRIDEATLDKTRGGVWLAEGRSGQATIRITRRSKERTTLLVTIREGKNRELRRIFGRVGFPVLRLQRVKLGPLELKGLPKGKSRFLLPSEVDALLAATDPQAEG